MTIFIMIATLVICVYRECKSDFQFYFPDHELFLVEQLQNVK